MNMEYLAKAEEKIDNIPMMVNLISYRTRQLNRGARPMVKPDGPEQDNHDIVLKEIAEGKLTVEMAFTREDTDIPGLDFEPELIL